VRQFLKFAANHFPMEQQLEVAELVYVQQGDLNKTGDLLKDVYNLHKWEKITRTLDTNVDIRDFVGAKQYVDVGTLSGAACAGGECEIHVLRRTGEA
jgi:hypothetical protein